MNAKSIEAPILDFINQYYLLLMLLAAFQMVDYLCHKPGGIQ